MSIKNIHRIFNSQDTPKDIYRIVNGEKKLIKRVYKVISGKPVIVWDINDDLIIVYKIESDGWTITYPAIPGATGIVNFGDGTTQNYTGSSIYHYYEKQGEYTTTLKFDTKVDTLVARFDAYSIQSIVLPDFIETLPERFVMGGNFKKIDFGKVTSISEFCCDNCTKLESITIPNSVTSIGAWAFYLCGNLKSITFEKDSNLTELKNNVFGYTAIEEIYLPEQDIFFDSNNGQNILFESCSNLKIADLGGLVDFYPNTFYKCYELTDIYVSNRISSIDMYSSINYGTTSGAVTIHFNGTLEEWGKVVKKSSVVLDEMIIVCTDGSITYYHGDYFSESAVLNPTNR